MAEIINLNRYRKVRNRAAAEIEASNNRVLFGRKRAEVEVARKLAEKKKEGLDGKKLGD
jgi:hypothetical protein